MQVQANIFYNTTKRDGYPQCNLRVDGKIVARCNGGGYDMVGTVWGMWIAQTFPEQLRKLTKKFYGLSFHNPTFNPAKAIVKGTGQTVAQREKAGISLGLERYQAYHQASNPLPTKKHTLPRMDGACGRGCMETIFEAIGGKIDTLTDSNRNKTYLVTLPPTE